MELRGDSTGPVLDGYAGHDCPRAGTFYGAGRAPWPEGRFATRFKIAGDVITVYSGSRVVGRLGVLQPFWFTR